MQRIGFLANSRLSQTMPASALQLPHFVFILLTRQSRTSMRLADSHFSTRGATASFSFSSSTSDNAPAMAISSMPGIGGNHQTFSRLMKLTTPSRTVVRHSWRATPFVRRARHARTRCLPCVADNSRLSATCGGQILFSRQRWRTNDWESIPLESLSLFCNGEKPLEDKHGGPTAGSRLGYRDYTRRLQLREQPFG